MHLGVEGGEEPPAAGEHGPCPGQQGRGQGGCKGGMVQCYSARCSATVHGAVLQCTVQCYSAVVKCYSAQCYCAQCYSAQCSGGMLQCTVQCYSAQCSATVHSAVHSAQCRPAGQRSRAGLEQARAHSEAIKACTALHCTALHCTALHCSAVALPPPRRRPPGSSRAACSTPGRTGRRPGTGYQRRPALHCTALHCTALHCTMG
jgi:hypothetical protein